MPLKELFGSVDIGTNSTRFLLAEVEEGSGMPRIMIRERRMVITRLGEGVDATGKLSGGALERTRRALEGFGRALERVGSVAELSVVGTSAARDAANGGEFLCMVRDTLGVEPRILSGEEEAFLSFLGATHELCGNCAGGRPVLVVDIGGGSTELVLGRGEEILFWRSVDVGCVRMSERFLRGDPPRRDELEAMRREVDERLRPVLDGLLRLDRGLVVGLAGTVTTLAGMKLGLKEYDGEAIHGSRLTLGEAREMFGEMARRDLRERRAYMGMEPGRADIILGGTTVLLSIMEGLGVEEILVSEKDILDGLILEAWHRRRGSELEKKRALEGASGPLYDMGAEERKK